MTRSFPAVYENGILRPLEPLNLPDKEMVTITLAVEAKEKLGGIEFATLSDDEFDRLLDELASGPTLSPLPVDFSRLDVYTDHD
jgi:predicted DNA-binding antitoxin AbrB/MazE fold protein